MVFMIEKVDSDLTHHGIKGQKWGVRRYQTKSGALTSLGRNRLRNKAGTDSDDGDSTGKTSGGKSSSSEKTERDPNDSLTYRVGEKRLGKRLDKIEKSMTKVMSKRRTAERDEVIKENALLRQETEAALSNPKRVKSVGRSTVLSRTLASSAAAAASGASIVAALTIESAIPLAAVPVAAAMAGKKWLETID